VFICKYILNPHKNHGFFVNQWKRFNDRYIYPKKGYLSADCLLLDTELFIDLDSENDLRIAQNDGRKIVKYLDDDDKHELELIKFSGTKGIHLIYKCKYKLNPDPNKRIIQVRREKERIVNELKKLNLKTLNRLHNEIIKNPFSVSSALYSIKKNGNVVTPIDREDFMTRDIYKILSISNDKVVVEEKELASESKELLNDKKVATAKVETLATQQYPGGEGASLTSSPTSYFYRYMDSLVNGLKNNYVLVIEKHKDNFDVKMLKTLQKKYNLSDFYIWRVRDTVFAYNFKCLQFERMIKILRNINSENLNFFMKRKHLFIQISHSAKGDGSLKEQLTFLGKLRSEYAIQDTHSRPHCNYFGLKYDNMAGKDKNNIGIVELDEGVI